MRRHDQVFPAIQPAQIGNGDILEIDLLPETVVHREEDVEDAAMLQMPPLPQPFTSAPVILSLDAAIPPPPAQDHCDPNYLELLYYWNQYIDEMKLGFVSLPEALDLKAATLHASPTRWLFMLTDQRVAPMWLGVLLPLNMIGGGSLPSWVRCQD